MRVIGNREEDKRRGHWKVSRIVQIIEFGGTTEISGDGWLPNEEMRSFIDCGWKTVKDERQGVCRMNEREEWAGEILNEEGN